MIITHLPPIVNDPVCFHFLPYFDKKFVNSYEIKKKDSFSIADKKNKKRKIAVPYKNTKQNHKKYTERQKRPKKRYKLHGVAKNTEQKSYKSYWEVKHGKHAADYTEKQ